MKGFNKVLCLSAVLAVFTASVAAPGSSEAASGGVLEEFLQALSEESVTFGYNYVLDNGQVKMVGSGEVVLQGSCFIMKGDGLEVYCDGTAKWTVDRAAQEAIVESFDSEQPDYMANPALLVGGISQAFTLTSESSATFNSNPATALKLSPKPTITGISSATLYLKAAEDVTPLGLELALDEARTMTLTITSWSLTPSLPSDAFIPSSLTSDYIITDLR